MKTIKYGPLPQGAASPPIIQTIEDHEDGTATVIDYVNGVGGVPYQIAVPLSNPAEAIENNIRSRALQGIAANNNRRQGKDARNLQIDTAKTRAGTGKNAGVVDLAAGRTEIRALWTVVEGILNLMDDSNVYEDVAIRELTGIICLALEKFDNDEGT
jgi:hypothetical protein